MSEASALAEANVLTVANALGPVLPTSSSNHWVFGGQYTELMIVAWPLAILQLKLEVA
jgi:hypothetical protein